MRFGALVAAVAGALAAGSATAGSVDFNLSNDAFRIGGAQQIAGNGLEVDGDWLYEDDNGNVFGLGLHLMDDANAGRGALDIGIGGKVFYVDFDDTSYDGGSLAIGGKFRYTWPTFNRFGIGGQLYYAPGVTSTGDIDSYLEAALRAEYLVLRNANAYIGLRTIRVGVEPTDETETFESGLHVGIRLDF
jgi:hypothetical protein